MNDGLCAPHAIPFVARRRGGPGAWLLLAAVLLALPGTSWAQAAEVASPADPAASTLAAAAAVAGSTLGGFRAIRLGMTVDEVKAELLKEALFLYRGDPDVSLIPITRQTLIEVEGRTFVDRGYFQFNDGKLLVAIVVLARELVSYFDVYQALRGRYGETAALDPSQAVWKIGGTRLSLEKPVVLKYVDSEAFDALRDSGRLGRDYELETRQQFLDTL